MFHAGGLEAVPFAADGQYPGGMVGPFVDADGSVRGVGRALNPYGEWVWQRGAIDGSAASTPEGGNLDYHLRHLGVLRDVLVGEVATEDAVGFVARFGDRLFFGRSDATGFSPLRPIGTVPGGQLSTRLDASGRRHFFSTADGVVDELLLDANGAELRRLLELDLPDAHELVGVVPDDADGLLVFTLTGREPWVSGQTSTPPTGDLYGWHATLPEAPADPSLFEGPDAPELDMHAMPTGHDVEVCWGRGDPELEGWTLAGQPAQAVASGATCVVVQRDPFATADLTALDAWLVEGPIPEVGRVLFATAPSEVPPYVAVPDARRPIAALTNGGFGSRALHYGPMGTVVGAPANAVAIANNSIDPGIVDAGGGGVWQWELSVVDDCGVIGTPCTTLVRWGETTTRTLVPTGNGSKILGQVGGGGLLWHYQDPNGDNMGIAAGIAGLDGSFTPLPPVEGSVVTEYRAARADGLACGTVQPTNGADFELFCRDPDGTVRTAALPDPGVVNTILFSNGLWPGPDGFYSANNSGEELMWFFDPVALTFEPIELDGYTIENPDASRVVVPYWSADGDMFVLVHHPSQPIFHGILEVDAGTATAVTLPDTTPGIMFDNGKTIPQQLMIGDDFLVIANSDGNLDSILRIPRP